MGKDSSFWISVKGKVLRQTGKFSQLDTLRLELQPSPIAAFPGPWLSGFHCSLCSGKWACVCQGCPSEHLHLFSEQNSSSDVISLEFYMRVILAYLAEMWAGEPHIILQNMEMLLLFCYFHIFSASRQYIKWDFQVIAIW